MRSGKISFPKVSLSTLAISIVLSAGPAYADDCSNLSLKNQAARSGSPIETFDWISLAKKDVVMIGDEHTYSKPSDLLRIANHIKEGYGAHEKACLFLEFPISLSLGKFKEILRSETGQTEQIRYFRYYKDILENAESSGFRPHLVDHAGHLESDIPINERDKAMAENISSLFRSGTCERGIMIVGKAHISPDESGRKMIRAHLEEMGRGVSTINIQYADEVIPDWGLKSWNGLCPARSAPRADVVVFSNESISEIALYPRYSPLTLLGYFDFTVLFP